MKRNSCPICDEEMVRCEGCGDETCFCCAFDGWTYDNDGIYLCPKCSAEAHDEWLIETQNGTRICSKCYCFDPTEELCTINEEYVYNPEINTCEKFKS